ncbi:MAG: TIGR02466 family protein [Pseudomonadota bacterium]
MEFVDIFPKTIGVGELTSLTPEIIASAQALIDQSASVHIEGDGGYTADQQLLNKPLFAEVRHEILGFCRDFANAHSHIVDELHICNSWGNVVKSGENIHYHAHNNSYISGTFYLTEGSAFNILNSHLRTDFSFAPAIRPGENYRAMESFTINPKPRRIIVFPSGLQHCVLQSKSNTSRYSIAFNVIPIGKIGGPTSLMEIRPLKE